MSDYGNLGGMIERLRKSTTKRERRLYRNGLQRGLHWARDEVEDVSTLMRLEEFWESFSHNAEASLAETLGNAITGDPEEFWQSVESELYPPSRDDLWARGFVEGALAVWRYAKELILMDV